MDLLIRKPFSFELPESPFFKDSLAGASRQVLMSVPAISISSGSYVALFNKGKHYGRYSATYMELEVKHETTSFCGGILFFHYTFVFSKLHLNYQLE